MSSESNIGSELENIVNERPVRVHYSIPRGIIGPEMKDQISSKTPSPPNILQKTAEFLAKPFIRGGLTVGVLMTAVAPAIVTASEHDGGETQTKDAVVTNIQTILGEHPLPDKAIPYYAPFLNDLGTTVDDAKIAELKSAPNFIKVRRYPGNAQDYVFDLPGGESIVQVQDGQEIYVRVDITFISRTQHPFTKDKLIGRYGDPTLSFTDNQGATWYVYPEMGWGFACSADGPSNRPNFLGYISSLEVFEPMSDSDYANSRQLDKTVPLN